MTLTVPDLAAVAALIEARLDEADARLYQPRYNVAPTDPCFVAREIGGSRVLIRARWGIRDARGALVINARSETVAARPLFREAYAGRRCVVPADGFYEWTGPRNDRRPLWFHLRERGASQLSATATQGIFFFAGIIDEAEIDRGEAEGKGGLASFCVLTTAANALVAPVHDRMPVILDAAQARRFLAQPDPLLLGPAPELFLASLEVSPRVNNVANDDAALLQPPSAAVGQRGQLKLGLT